MLFPTSQCPTPALCYGFCGLISVSTWEVMQVPCQDPWVSGWSLRLLVRWLSLDGEPSPSVPRELWTCVPRALCGGSGSASENHRG